MPRRLSYSSLSAGLCGFLLLPACSSPFRERSKDDLRASLTAEATRHLDPAAGAPSIKAESGAEPDALPFSEDELAELDRLGGPAAYTSIDLGLGPDLLGQAQSLRPISLRESIAAALSGNLRAASARLLPAINDERVTVAESVFDWVFFGDVAWSALDQPARVPVINGVVIGQGEFQENAVGYSTGLRKDFTSGGRLTVLQGQTYRDSRSSGTQLFPDPSNEAVVDLGFDQPLLRGFGEDANLAEVHISRNLSDDALLEYEQTLIDVLTETETAYWDLLQARHELQIRQKLLGMGEAVRDQLEARMEFDARVAEYADAIATTEQRRGAVIVARNLLRQQSDRLKALIEVPGLSVGGEELVLPTDAASEVPVTFNLLDSLALALAHRPEVERALLNIDTADVLVAEAKDAKLPLLDLSLRTIYRGLERDGTDAYDEVFASDFVDYIVGVQFEQPIGNRGAEAEYTARRLERVRALAQYREVLQQVVVEVKSALRDVETAYSLIEQTHISRLAATESLRTLEAREVIEGITPTFLDLKLRRQEALAAAELNEITARLEYARALARLAAAQGTTLDAHGIALVRPTADELLDLRRGNDVGVGDGGE